MIAIHVKRVLLTDGSPVFDVEIGDTTFHCVTQEAASGLATAFIAAIDKYTVEDARVFDFNM